MKKVKIHSSSLDDRDSAKRLRDDILLHQNDLRWCSENYTNTIIYAVDNDIIRLFSDAKASSIPGQVGYAQIFTFDSDSNSIGLGVILSHYIFYSLGKGSRGSGPKLLIPPLDREFASNLSVLLGLASKEHDVAQTQVAAFDKLLNNTTMRSEADFAQQLLDNAPKILDILFGTNSYSAQAKKRCALVNENRLTSLVEVNDSQTYGLPPKFIEVCLRKKSLPELIWANDLRNEWISLLDDPRYDEKRRRNLEDDADALSTLQLINTRLEGSGIRLVLITGAPNLLNKGLKITVKNAGQNYRFSDLWLRHPRCFLGDPMIFNSDIGLEKNYDDNYLMTLLDAFLAEGKSEENYQSQKTVEAYKNDQLVGEKYSMAIVEFQDSWNRFIANLCLGHADIMEQVSYSEHSLLLERIREISNAKSSLQELLKKSWQDVFFAAIQTGFLYSLHRWSLAKMLPRNLPKLIFGSFDPATKFIDDVIKQTPGTEVSDFRHRIEEVGNDSSKRYTTYLVFGVLFAAQNNWRIVESLADNAIRLFFGDHQSVPAAVRADPERIITGREAYFLKAVAKRHLARSVGDLTDAQNTIMLAMQMLALEREVRGNILPNDTRFEYELCSINVARAMFEKFLKAAPVFPERLATEQLLAKLNAILDTRNLANQEDVCGSSREDYRILTSLFIVELTLNCNIGDPFPDRLRQHLTHFRNITHAANAKVHPTQLGKIIYSIADWWGESDVLTKEQKKTIALDTIDHSIKSLRDGVGMPYERERCKYLKDFVMCDLGNSGMATYESQ